MTIPKKPVVKKVIQLLSSAIVLVCVSTGFATAGNILTLAGDPCSVPLAQKLAEAYSARNAAFKVELQTFGCTQGVYKASSGSVDIGVSTQNGLSSNTPKGGFNTVIAKSPIVLIVHQSNPVNNLSYDQLQGIMSGKIKNWKDVGGTDLEIGNVMLAPCVRNTMAKHVVPMSKDIVRLKPGKKVNPVTHTNIMVASNKGAIGQQIYGYESEDVKVLTIDGVLPDEKTSPKQYAFYQDYNIITHGKPTGSVKDYIDFAYTDEGKSIIKAMNHIPLN